MATNGAITPSSLLHVPRGHMNPLAYSTPGGGTSTALTLSDSSAASPAMQPAQQSPYAAVGSGYSTGYMVRVSAASHLDEVGVESTAVSITKADLATIMQRLDALQLSVQDAHRAVENADRRAAAAEMRAEAAEQRVNKLLTTLSSVGHLMES
ncbi:hypothetical protein CYMTET_25997 [Cymbomonas tetramitiformis]|uniref:Uncharacterized protein n=1 Tax=Cymbomonas tetramitiformis TaxID=36881 RepID=A0AAE0KYL7_9CHLO|nr:hypothetical protein CYMTET_25997 [Cymbomonas tetramitiformis]